MTEQDKQVAELTARVERLEATCEVLKVTLLGVIDQFKKLLMTLREVSGASEEQTK